MSRLPDKFERLFERLSHLPIKQLSPLQVALLDRCVGRRQHRTENDHRAHHAARPMLAQDVTEIYDVCGYVYAYGDHPSTAKPLSLQVEACSFLHARSIAVKRQRERGLLLIITQCLLIHRQTAEDSHG